MGDLKGGRATTIIYVRRSAVAAMRCMMYVPAIPATSLGRNDVGGSVTNRAKATTEPHATPVAIHFPRHTFVGPFASVPRVFKAPRS